MGVVVMLVILGTVIAALSGGGPTPAWQQGYSAGLSLVSQANTGGRPNTEGFLEDTCAAESNTTGVKSGRKPQWLQGCTAGVQHGFQQGG